LAILKYKKLANVFGRKQGFVTSNLFSKYLLQSFKNPSKIVLIAIHKLLTSRLDWMSTHEAP